MKLSMGSQERKLFTSLLDRNLPCGTLGRIQGKKRKGWIDNQHRAMWQGLTSAQRQARKLISGPDPTAKTWLPSFNRIQSRVFTGLLTGHDTLRTHLYIMGLIDSPCVGGVEQRRKSELPFCMSVKPWWHSNMPIWVSFSWTMKMLEVKDEGQYGTLLKERGFQYLDISLRGKKGLSKRSCYIGTERARTHLLYSILIFAKC